MLYYPRKQKQKVKSKVPGKEEKIEKMGEETKEEEGKEIKRKAFYYIVKVERITREAKRWMKKVSTMKKYKKNKKINK